MIHFEEFDVLKELVEQSSNSCQYVEVVRYSEGDYTVWVETAKVRFIDNAVDTIEFPVAGHSYVGL